MANFSKVPGIVKDVKGNPVIEGKYNNSNEEIVTKEEILTIKAVEAGPASVFRETLNNNFNKIDKEIDNVYKNMVNIVVSNEDESPIEYQKAGDFWFRVLNENNS